MKPADPNGLPQFGDAELRSAMGYIIDVRITVVVAKVAHLVEPRGAARRGLRGAQQTRSLPLQVGSSGAELQGGYEITLKRPCDEVTSVIVVSGHGLLARLSALVSGLSAGRSLSPAPPVRYDDL